MRLELVPDGPLAERAIDGDERAFAVLARRHTPFLRAFAVRYLRGSVDADDVVQEALINAWRNLHRLEDPSKVRTWLATAVARRAADVARTRARRGDQVLDDDDRVADHSTPDAVVERHATTRALHDAIERLPDDQREVWVLREFADLSYDEIAARTGSSIATVRGRLSRARTSIIAAMSGWK